MSEAASGSAGPSRAWRVAVALLVGWAGFWLVATFPGEVSPDTLDQYAQGIEGVYTNAHPPLLSWLLGASGRLAGGTGPAFVAQLGLGALGLVLILPPRMRGAAGWLGWAAVAFCPLLWAQWASVWKDCWMSVVFLGVLAALARERWVLAIGLTAAMVCFRHNGLILVPPLALWAAARLWSAGRARALAVAAGLLVAAWAPPRLVERALDARDVHPAAATLVFDVAGIYRRAPARHAEGPYLGQVELERIVAAYDSRSARWLVSDRRGVAGLRLGELADDEAYARLRAEWRRLVQAEPLAWAVHRTRFGCQYLGICNSVPFDPYGRTYATAWQSVPTVNEGSRAWKLAEWLRLNAARPLARGWIWTLALLVVAVAAWRRRQGLVLATAAAALLYTAANLVVAPSAPFRYHLPTLVALALGLPWVLSSGGAGEERGAAPRPGPAGGRAS